MAQAASHTRGTTHRVNESLQQERYGGFNFLSAFFGWLTSIGVSSILISFLAAAGSAVAVSKLQQGEHAITGGTLGTVGLVSGLLFLIALAIAYFVGGYVAGRMARYDGIAQGIGVWALGVIIVLLLGILGAVLGAQYNIFQQLSMPHIPINEGALTVGGLITTLLAIAVTLGAAIAGGKLGENYHRKIDELGQVRKH